MASEAFPSIWADTTSKKTQSPAKVDWSKYMNKKQKREIKEMKAKY